MLDRDELLPAEQAHPALLQELRATYHIKPEEEQMLARVHERLERLAQGSLPHADQKPGRTSAPLLEVGSPAPFSRPTRPGKRRFRRLNAFAAVLLTGVLVSSLVLILALISRSRVASPHALSTAPVKNGILLTNGFALQMFTEQTGWVMDNYQSPGYIFHTIDGGKHWQNITPPGYNFDGKSYDLAELYALDENTAWLPLFASRQGQKVGLLGTTDGGKTWQRLSLPGNASTGVMTFSDQDNGWVLMPPTSVSGSASTPVPLSTSSKQVLYHTHDGGKTWQTVGPVPAPFSSMRFLDDQTGWATATTFVSTHDRSKPFSSKATLYATSNSGRTWMAQSPLSAPQEEKGNAPPAQLSILNFVNASKWYLLAGFHSSYVYQTQDAGNTWQVVGAQLPANVDVRDMIDSQHSVGEIIVDPQRSALGLVTLTLTNGHWQETARHLAGDLIDESFLSPNVGFVLIAASAKAPHLFPTTLALYQTTNGGNTWQKLATLPTAS
jgi:photosystem II stability/assembly factor-like uncharacterized protein